MANYTVAQSGDTDDAANISALSGIENISDFVADGLNFTNVNHTDNTFDLTDGEVYILLDSMTADRAGEERYNCLITSHLDTGITGLSFVDGIVNHVYIRANTGVDDAPKVDVLQDQSNATDDSVRIGVIDDTQSMSYEVNRDPDGVFESLEADDVVIRNSLTANGLVDTEALADYAATASKIAQNAITDGKIASNAVGSDELQNDSVTASEISDNAVTTAAIAAGSVTSSLISSGAVGADAIGENAVNTEEIAEEAITKSLMANGAVDTEQLRADSVNPEQVEESGRYRIDGVTTTAPVKNESYTQVNGQVGASRGEISRAGGATSDTLWNVQGGGGHVAWTWNAEFRGGEWRYITDDVSAMGIQMDRGDLNFWTADGGNSGDSISWEEATVNDGKISNAYALGGNTADQYARLDQTKIFDRRQKFDAPIELLNHDGIGSNTSHDIIYRNSPSGDEIHHHYRRPEWVLFERGGGGGDMLRVHKNGDLKPQGNVEFNQNRHTRVNHLNSLGLEGGSTEPSPPYVGARLYYYNNRLFAVNDAGVTEPIAEF